MDGLTRTRKSRRTPRHGSANARDCHLPPKRLPPRVTQIDIDHILLIEEIRQLLEAAEQVGTMRASDLAEIAETYELGLEQDAVLRGSTSVRSRSSSSRPTPRRS